MMVSGDMRLDELILQVFEEHEDIFFWPVCSQKDAKTFVKFIHEKGAPYEDICKEIGEFEHNFSAWRKGLGRVGIGTRMIERINKTVESVIESDDEDNLEFNLKQLAKVNKKSEGKAQKSKSTTEKSQPVPSPTKEPKQQQSDLMNSMSKNIDKHVEQKKPPKREEPSQKNEATHKSHKELQSKSEPLTNGSATAKGAPKKQEPMPAKREPVPEHREPVAKREQPTQERVVKEEKVAKHEIVEEKEKESKKSEHNLKEKETEKEENVQEKEEEKQEGEKHLHDDKEVDAVKKKMEAIRKKVEMMKKQKAEKQAGSHPPSDHVEGQAASTGQSGVEGGDKYEAMRKRIEELRNKIKTDDDQRTPEEEQESDDRVPPKPKEIPRSPTVETAPSETLIPPMAAEEDGLQPENAEEDDDHQDLGADEIYDSDLDPDNYDSDLEYDLYKDVKKLANQIQNEKSRLKERDGPGHVFIFSDSPPGERQHRIKVGATRSPEKKFRQAQSFNPSFIMVSCTAVGKRKAAISEIHKVLSKYKLESYDNWFCGPIEKVLQNVSVVTEKYGSGPALTSFQTDTNC